VETPKTEKSGSFQKRRNYTVGLGGFPVALWSKYLSNRLIARFSVI
jgi:hypothetical protein